LQDRIAKKKSGRRIWGASNFVLGSKEKARPIIERAFLARGFGFNMP
jgi:hypothetical protein